MMTCNIHGRDQEYRGHRTAPSQSQPTRTDAVSPSEIDGKTTADIATNNK